MACAKCDFYMPKESTAALLLEGKTHLLRLLQEIPLGDAKQAAIEEGVAAYENLLSKLADLPTPAGPTPRQIGAELVQVTSVRRTCAPAFCCAKIAQGEPMLVSPCTLIPGQITPRRSYLDQGGTTPLVRAYAIDCPRCSC